MTGCNFGAFGESLPTDSEAGYKKSSVNKETLPIESAVPRDLESVICIANSSTRRGERRIPTRQAPRLEVRTKTEPLTASI